MSEVEKAFRKFAIYGDTSASGNGMTGKNFSKMCKECGIMDGKTVTSTDVDIVFNKIKTKGAHTITFAEFQQAMKELCIKRFKGKPPEEALQAVYGLIEGKKPGSMGATKATKIGRVMRLTLASTLAATKSFLTRVAEENLLLATRVWQKTVAMLEPIRKLAHKTRSTRRETA